MTIQTVILFLFVTVVVTNCQYRHVSSSDFIPGLQYRSAEVSASSISIAHDNNNNKRSSGSRNSGSGSFRLSASASNKQPIISLTIKSNSNNNRKGSNNKSNNGRISSAASSNRPILRDSRELNSFYSAPSNNRPRIASAATNTVPKRVYGAPAEATNNVPKRVYGAPAAATNNVPKRVYGAPEKERPAATAPRPSTVYGAPSTKYGVPTPFEATTTEAPSDEDSFGNFDDDNNRDNNNDDSNSNNNNDDDQDIFSNLNENSGNDDNSNNVENDGGSSSSGSSSTSFDPVDNEDLGNFNTDSTNLSPSSTLAREYGDRVPEPFRPEQTKELGIYATKDGSFYANSRRSKQPSGSASTNSERKTGYGNSPSGIAADGSTISLTTDFLNKGSSKPSKTKMLQCIRTCLDSGESF